MVSGWIPAHWSRRLTPAPGMFIDAHLRLVRPVVDAGDGNMWVAEHLGLRRQVCVTLAGPHPQSGEAVDPADIERFVRQTLGSMHASSRVTEPHFVQVFEHGVAKGGVPFIVSELIEGKSLRDLMVQNGALSLAEAESVVAQVAGALAKAHALGVVHGSICPDKLFLVAGVGQPLIKVAGLGATSGPSPHEHNPSNHPYLSPEQLLFTVGDEAQSDLWALAVTLYELLTTILPFEAPSSAGITVAICNAQFSSPSHYRADLPRAIDLWFERALSKTPADRFADATELAYAFKVAVKALPSAAAARGESEVDDEEAEEEDERTMKWDLPVDWAAVLASPAVASPAVASPAVASPAVVSPAVVFPAVVFPAVAPSALPLPSTPPPLPNRHTSSRPPPPFAAAALTGMVAAALPTQPPATSRPEPTQPRAVPAPSYLASVTSARAVPSAARGFDDSARAEQSHAPPPVQMMHKRLLLAGLAGISLVVAAGTYRRQTAEVVAGPITVETAESESELIVTRTVRVDDLAEVGSADHQRPRAGSEALPKIIHTQDLPPAPDEAEGAEELSGAPGPVAQAAAPIAAARPARPAAPGPAAPGPVIRHSAVKSAGCNPPYYLDSQNIRRLKLECLSGSTGATAPDEKAQAPSAAGGVPPRAKPLKEARASGGCTPPYYFDNNNIRRLKLECL